MEDRYRAMQEAARLQGQKEMRERIEKARAERRQREQKAAEEAAKAAAQEDGEIVEESKAADAIVTSTIKNEDESSDEIVVAIKQQPEVKSEPDADGAGDAPGISARQAKTSEVTATKAQLAERQAAAEAELAKVRKDSASFVKASQEERLRDFQPQPKLASKTALADRSTGTKSQQNNYDPLASWNARKDKESRLDTSSKTLNGRKASGKELDVRSSKRTEPSSGFGDERRSSKKRASISERASVSDPSSSVSSPQSPTSPEESLATERSPPEWYKKLNFVSSRGRNDPESSNVDILLGALKTQVRKAQEQVKKAKAGGKAINLQDIFEAVREKLHSAFFLRVTGQALRNVKILDNANGLPQIFDRQFDQGVAWPYDIRADAEELYNKWCREDYETDLMRGIDCTKPKKLHSKEVSDRASDKIREDYPKIKADYFGGGKLLNGQWWPTQLTCLRDGAHGSSQGGIYSGRQGVYSCIMADGYSDDEDHGDIVLYCGTDDNGRTGVTTEETKRMMLSMNKNKVRLIRSSKVPSRWAPEKGFRYDGLYDIVGKERIDPEGHPRARHRFKLVRCPGQDPIRGGSGPEKRPTRQELEAYEKDKHLRGF